MTLTLFKLLLDACDRHSHLLMVRRQHSDCTFYHLSDDDTDGVPAERIFLHKLLHAHESDQKPSTSNGSDDDERQHLEAALRTRKATTKKTLGQIVAAIDNERQRNEELAAVLRQKVSSDGMCHWSFFLKVVMDGAVLMKHEVFTVKSASINCLTNSFVLGRLLFSAAVLVVAP